MLGTFPPWMQVALALSVVNFLTSRAIVAQALQKQPELKKLGYWRVRNLSYHLYIAGYCIVNSVLYFLVEFNVFPISTSGDLWAPLFIGFMGSHILNLPLNPNSSKPITIAQVLQFDNDEFLRTLEDKIKSDVKRYINEKIKDPVFDSRDEFILILMNSLPYGLSEEDKEIFESALVTKSPDYNLGIFFAINFGKRHLDDALDREHGKKILNDFQKNGNGATNGAHESS
ncbi:hypothetical protein [Acanthopleuribacter pedis]|uniref:Uncharacterized protein n=1 Tax=Acanthopleuribacter pedis TaxID=442870 RepID=A0A8J7QQA4_9BACT|nr:hypothetical protein [Acanthopleuribacter pedis]MBO1322195.1 hypothetical protein [Acanthopleuribacter pedis]